MKKYIILALFLAVLVVTPALAQTDQASVAWQISVLKAQIAQLTLQLQQLLNQQSGSFCYNFNRSFGLGTGATADVRALHQILIKEGVKTPYSDADPFESRTEQGVKFFQQRYGISQTGFVGSFTRAKLNSLYGCKINTGAPVISGISGPTTLKVGEQGTWTINATDPTNGVLNYSIDWGDTESSNTTPSAGSPATIRQTATFTHTYNRLGNFSPTFYVSNNFGQARSSLSVNVTNANQPTITVISPNGGEVWAVNSVHDINWNVANLGETFAAVKYDLYLDQYSLPCIAGQVCTYNAIAPITLDKAIIGGPYHWIVATDIVNNPIPSGEYRVRVCFAGAQTNCDSSDRSFTIGYLAAPATY